MVGEISSIYFQCYQMAYDLAKRAEGGWQALCRVSDFEIAGAASLAFFKGAMALTSLPPCELAHFASLEEKEHPLGPISTKSAAPITPY
jgi:hypothetical protein